MLSRTGFLGAGLAAAAGASALYAPRARAASSLQVWGLDPNWGGDPSACGCGACAACRAHAVNKLFASAAAADAARAHPYCKCLVVPLARVEEVVYDALFVTGGSRASVDRRYQWVQAVLAQGPPVPPPSQSTGAASENGSKVAAPDSGPAPAPAPGTRPAADTVVESVLGRVCIRRAADGTRVLYAEIKSAEVVTARVEITRQKKVLVRKSAAGLNGRRTLQLRIPRSVKPGPVRLHLRLRDEAGNAKSVTREILIPRRT